tara:strand:- start:1336 stop:1479 length:144 start_codon:yes stop_codon:yes gene_type:complete
MFKQININNQLLILNTIKMKKVLFLAVAFTASFAMAQDLPSNPEPGK